MIPVPTTRILDTAIWRQFGSAPRAIPSTASNRRHLGPQVGALLEGPCCAQKSVYRYEDDMTGLLQALKDDSFICHGKKYSKTEIDDLRHSKRWKQPCDLR